MPLDLWFPLAIYYVDLPDGERQNPAITARIAALFAAAGAPRTATSASWTGDVHGVDRLHRDPAFSWLTEQVGRHALAYLRVLGHDLARTELYIQRSWPVVARRGQRVARHAHHAAHLSAVYYVAAPPGSGQIRFHNDAQPNEIASGIGSAMTGGYAEPGPLNYGSVVYQPIPGRLLVFPAKQTHSVEPNATPVRAPGADAENNCPDDDACRVSISYDLIITARGDRGEQEYLMPSPTLWDRIENTAPDAATEFPEPAPAAADPSAAASLRAGPRVALATVARHAEAIDAFTLADAANHALWTTLSLAHVASPSSGAVCAAILGATTPADWVHDANDGSVLWHGADRWPIYRDAIDRIHGQLRLCEVPLDGATVFPPVIKRRQNGARSRFDRGHAHLCAYLNLYSCTPDNAVSPVGAIEFAEGDPVALPPGSMVVVSGFRRHRVTGGGDILQVNLDLPALARTATLALPAMHAAAVGDRLVFAAATAQPLDRVAPTMPAIIAKIAWLDARLRRRRRHEACPATRRFLIDHADPASAQPAELAIIRGHGLTRARESTEERVIAIPDTLTPAACMILRDHADAHLTSVAADSVDDLPEYQVNLSRDTLAMLVGMPVVDKLLGLPNAQRDPTTRMIDDGLCRVDILLRVYSTKTRPYIAFHADTCTYTVNIALTGDDEIVGGKLIVLDGDGLRCVARRAGTALLHAGDVVHGVSKTEHGTRYSLILFFTSITEPEAIPAHHRSAGLGHATHPAAT